MSTVLAFGEVLWDVYPDEKYMGGAPLNFAAHFVKQGGRAYLASALGDDALGHEALEKVLDWGIDADYLPLLSDRETGRCLVRVDEKGIPTYNLLNDVAYDFIDCKIRGKEFDALYFGTLAIRGDFNLEKVRSLLQNNNFHEVYVDVNVRPPFFSKERLLFALENATILKISDEELPVLAETLFRAECGFAEAALQISSMYRQLKLILITRAEKGSYLYDCEHRAEYFSDAVKTRVVSTVGAGDSFSAAFLYHYLRGAALDDCLIAAGRLSAFVVSKPDAVPEYE